MVEIPENIKALYRSDNDREETAKYVRLYFYDQEPDFLFPSEDLFPSEELFPVEEEPFTVIDYDRISMGSLQITEMLCENELKFGECCGAMVEVIVADVDEDITGKEFMLTIECGGYEMIMGIYRVESFVRQQADRRLRKITAYNRMRRFHVDVAEWYNSLTFPMTLKQFRDSLCAHVGLKQNKIALPLDEMVVSKTIEPEQLYGLDVLRAICEINGGFGQIDRMGAVRYVFLGESSLYPSEDLFPSEELFPGEMDGENLTHYKQSDTSYEDYLVAPIDKLKIRQEEGDVGVMVGDGTNAYTIQGNFLVYGKSSQELEQIAWTAYENISGRTYRPCDIVSPAIPWVEPGDGIICHTTDDVIETYCFRRTISGIQAMMDNFEASGDAKREDDFSQNARIIQLEGKAAVIKKSVEEVSVKVSDLKEYTEAQVKILADEITLEVTRAKEAEAQLTASIRIQAEQIALEVTRAKEAEAKLSASIRIQAEQIVAEVTRAKEAEAQLSIRADQILQSVTDLKNSTDSQFLQMSDLISMKVSKGSVSSELSIEPDEVTLKTNRFSWEADNSRMSRDGTLNCRNIRAVNGYFSGVLESDYIGGNYDGAYLGDYIVSADGTNRLISSNGYVEIDCLAKPAGSPGGSYALLRISGGGYRGVIIDGLGNIECGEIKALNCSLAHGSSRVWGLGETIDWFWDEFVDLRNRVDNLP